VFFRSITYQENLNSERSSRHRRSAHKDHRARAIISIMQAGCRIVLSDQDVLPVFDAIAEVVADNRGFAERHHKARHSRKGKGQDAGGKHAE
jgi:hypothetical protein